MRNGEYELVIAPDDYPGMKYRDRYCYEHLLVWWMNTGRVPDDSEVIHHANGNKRDNRFENLILMTVEQHNETHSTGITMVELECPTCGRIFYRRRNITHLVITSKRIDFCSRKCVGEFNFRSASDSDKQHAEMINGGVAQLGEHFFCKEKAVGA